ncbi:MAG TPA: hypothetical protein VFJ06_06385 [Halococcus sp.]|nr:hypothetical protein [Halococcus sp.]
MDWRRVAIVSLLSLVAFAGIGSAHQIQTSRFAAPIPLEFLFGGAGVTVAATAVWLGRTGEASSMRRTWRSHPAIPATLATALRYGVRAVFFIGFLVAVFQGLFGPQVAAENFATVFVWAVWFEGVSLVSILIGSPWRILSPWCTLYEGLTWLESDEIALFGSYPSWLGSWPALFGFVVGIGIFGNLTVIPRSPAATAVIIAGYATVMVVGGVVFGEEWFRYADALSVLYRLFGRVAPIRFVEADGGYRVALRPPWAGCTRRVRTLSLVSFVIATVYTVSFDGFTNTPEYQTVLFGLRDALDSGPTTSVLVYAIGLCGFVVAFVAVSEAMSRVAGEGRQWRNVALAFAPTVLPIAAAYEVAHNYPFVLGSLGRLAALAWSMSFSPVEPITLLSWLSLPVFWGSQVILIIAGHIIAVVAAHTVAVERYETLTRARQAHLPLVALMVGYTVLSLWIISRPVVS